MEIDEELEKQYSPSQWCFRRCDVTLAVQKHIETVAESSSNVRNEIPFEANVRYGESPRQLLDIYEPENGENNPTFVYIHGGYWQDLSKDISSYCVRPLLRAGVRVIIPDYDLAPNVSLSFIVKEIEELAKFLCRTTTIRQWGVLWFGGHSAGAHLAASILFSSSEHIAGFIFLSGIYDLSPLLKTTINSALKLTSDEAEKLSPLLNQVQLRFRGTVLMVVGEFDSPAFHRQQQLFAQVLKKHNIPVKEICIPQTDHFTLVEQLNDEDYYLTKLITNTIR